MSRIGNRVLDIPAGIKVDIGEAVITISSSSKSLVVPYNKFHVKPSIKDNKFMTEKVNNSKHSRAQYGTINAIVANAFHGLVNSFVKVLEIVGVGYKASMAGSQLRLDLGYSHPIFLDIPKDVEIKLISSVEIEVKSFNRHSVGEFAAKIRGFRPPEPYKGKGVKYKDEIILRKIGKTSDGGKKK